jgi:hypothetical protein
MYDGRQHLLKLSRDLWCPGRTSVKLHSDSWFRIESLSAESPPPSSLPHLATFSPPTADDADTSLLRAWKFRLYLPPPSPRTLGLASSPSLCEKLRRLIGAARFFYNRAVGHWRENGGVVSQSSISALSSERSCRAAGALWAIDKKSPVPSYIRGGGVRDFWKALEILRKRREKDPNFRFSFHMRKKGAQSETFTVRKENLSVCWNADGRVVGIVFSGIFVPFRRSRRKNLAAPPINGGGSPQLKVKGASPLPFFLTELSSNVLKQG